MAATRRRGRNIRGALAAACGLLGLSGPQAGATEVHTAAMGYTESDRVSLIETVVDVNHTFGDGKITTFRLVYDALTGASANGAVPAAFTQTFTGPSGETRYSAAPGKTPLDPTFRDTRVALSGGLTQPVGRLSSWSVGLYGSTEHDYTSLGANTALTRDFNRRNTTLAVRAAYFHDTISPEGGRPLPLTAVQPGEEDQQRLGGNGTMLGPVDDDEHRNQPRLAGDGTKQVLDLGVGVTQVLNPMTVVHLNFTHSRVSGYQTDPYKIISYVDSQTGDPLDYLYERRPDSRSKNILFGRLVHGLGDDVVQLSYRFMHDSWNIDSHTVDARYRWNLNESNYLQPHVRWYTQKAAEFYRRYLMAEQSVPEYATADYRLGAMQTWTWGLKYGRHLPGGRELSVSLEYYRQSGESHPANAAGALRQYDLFPDVDAMYLQVGYSFGL